MKQLLLFAFAFCFSLTIAAQDTAHIVNYYGDGKLHEKYDLNSKKEKNGAYICYSTFGKIYISGHYKNGMPVGTWEYFSSDTSGILVQKLDFDTHKELFVDPLH